VLRDVPEWRRGFAVDLGLGQADILAQVVRQAGQRPALAPDGEGGGEAVAKSETVVERPATGRVRDAVRCAMAFPFDSLNTNRLLISMLDIWRHLRSY
jgi:hypothetical protein